MVLRVGYRAWSGPTAFWTDGYTFFFDLAERLAAGEGYVLGDGSPTAFRVPLYPLVLAVLTGGERAFWPVLAFQALISTGTVACAALIARELFGRRSTLAAAAVCAIYPYYVIHDTSLAETGLFTFFTALGVLLLIQAQRRGSLGRAAGAGLVLGLAILTRATIAPFVPLAAGWLAVSPAASGIPRERAVAAAVLLAMTLLTLSPWLAYSRSVTGSMTLGTEFGAALFAGNHPLTFSAYPEGSIDQSRARIFTSLSPADRADLEKLGQDEIAISGWYLRRGVDRIASHPAETLAGGASKLAAAFGPLPSPRKAALANIVNAVTYGPIALLALVGAWHSRRSWRVIAPLYLIIATFLPIAALLWAHTAHRSYLDVYLIVLAAPVLAALTVGGRARRRWG